MKRKTIDELKTWLGSELTSIENKAERERRSEQVTELMNFLDERREDHREATKIAVDASKTLLQIAVAGIVAVAGFFQYAISHGVGVSSAAIILLYVAGISTGLSMILGMHVISKAYKRGDGRDGHSPGSWGTDHLSRLLNGQAFLGLIAVVFFSAGTIGIGLQTQPTSERIELHYPGGGVSAWYTPSAEVDSENRQKVQIEGHHDLVIKDSNGESVPGGTITFHIRVEPTDAEAQ